MPFSALRLAALALPALVLLAASPAASRTRYVTMYGVDPLPNGLLDSCAKTKPCRTLNHAIFFSQPGDTIVVGPGRYDVLTETLPAGCSCMIDVDRPLRIVSRDGAFTTILDAGSELVDVVRLAADGVTFGTRKHGFTLTAGGGTGLYSLANGSAIGGNVAFANAQYGFQSVGPGVVLAGNIAIANAGGFLVEGSDATLSGNLAFGNAGTGIDLQGPGALATENVASLNTSDGIALIGGPHTLLRSASVGNSGGLRVIGSPASEVDRTSVIGSGTGASLEVGVLVHRLNLFGSGDFCGGFNTSGVEELPLLETFWGAATGPGVIMVGPADNDDCGTSTIDSEPFATKEIKVVPKKVNAYLP